MKLWGCSTLTPSAKGFASRARFFECRRWKISRALKLGLKQSHDKAAAKLNLAVVASSRRKLGEAKQLLNECKRLDEKGYLSRDIKTVEDAIRGGGPRQAQGRGARRKASRGKK